jgi:molybdopterin molybdotransferase
MITVTEAKQLIKENCPAEKTAWIPLIESFGYVLAEPVYSLIDTPPFNQSAMDGYTFSFNNWDGKSELKVVGEIQAGIFSDDLLNPNECIRIYTGAALPYSADTVVMQEKVITDRMKVSVIDEQLTKGNNVRLKGSQTKKGECILETGHLLTPAAISFLASAGIDKVNIYSKPTVSIIVTGKELVHLGEIISGAKIYESNSFGLTAALNQLNISPVSVCVVDDQIEEIANEISKHLHFDILILTGGVSVGDYDFVSSALEKCGVQKIFHKVKQKLGKPLYFGRFKQTLVFALPGNPAAVLSCFYEYVMPAISSYTKKEYFKTFKFPLANDFKKKPGITFFLKGKTSENEVAILNNQESYLMNSFAMADCIVELDEERDNFKKGDLVTISMII